MIKGWMIFVLAGIGALIAFWAVMKPILEPVMRAVPYLGGRESAEIRRLLAVLDTIVAVDDISSIPGDSILRESIGGSHFDYV